MVPKLNLAQKGLILIAIPLFFELVFIGILAYFLHQSEVETQQEARSKAIVVQASSIVKKFYDAGTNILLYGATKSERAAKQYEETKSCIRDSFAALQGYVGNDSSRMADLASMERAADTVI